MNRLNRIFTLSSVSVLLVTIERFSFTTKVLLQPYSFMRLHEMFQIIVLILLTVIVPFLLFKEVTGNFETIKKQKGFWMSLLFLIGVYFYATGNGMHETAGFFFNQYCDVKNFIGQLCGGLFFNDYYTGNIFYFIGAALMVIPLLFLEKILPNKEYQEKDLAVTLINAVIYAFAIFAYAAFDRVLVGLAYSIIVSLIALWFFVPIRKKYLSYPIITYTTTTYVLGTLTALIVKLL